MSSATHPSPGHLQSSIFRFFSLPHPHFDQFPYPSNTSPYKRSLSFPAEYLHQNTYPLYLLPVQIFNSLFRKINAPDLPTASTIFQKQHVKIPTSLFRQPHHLESPTVERNPFKSSTPSFVGRILLSIRPSNEIRTNNNSYFRQTNTPDLSTVFSIPLP